VVVNKLKYFICELDLFFYRRGAEGTEAEKKEINLKSQIDTSWQKISIVGKSETIIVIPSQSKI
jgi:hypothetical protein